MLIIKLIFMLSKITMFVGNKENKGGRVFGLCNQPYAVYSWFMSVWLPAGALLGGCV